LTDISNSSSRMTGSKRQVLAVELIGAPSSAGAFSRGQENAPAALRSAGIVEQLVKAGVAVTDAGDLPLQPWRPDRASPRAQNVDLVLANATGVRDRVANALRAGRRVLVLGGDCTTGLGTLAGAAVASHTEPSWLYFDLHADLNTTMSVPDGALDWTGMAHALGLADTIASLCAIGGVVPLIAPQRVILFSHDLGEATVWERQQIELLSLRRISHEEVHSDPTGMAVSALGQLKAQRPIVLHFDIDAINFTDAPLSEHTGRGSGIPLKAALTALRELMADDRVCAVTVTELNPQHAAADPAMLSIFVSGLVSAMAATR